MTPATTPTLAEVARYYASRLAEFGANSRGVDWNSEAGQELRFEQLARVIDRVGGFSLNDLGCGYGAMLDFLDRRFSEVRYSGYDISPEMVAAGHARHALRPAARFELGSAPGELADYGVASGIFNVRLRESDEAWIEHIVATLGEIDRTSRSGFAFNCLSAYSDREKMRPDLYYADPCYFFDLCKQRFSRNVALLHDYGLYEFTIIVRKSK